MRWKTLDADGCTWEVRSIVNPTDTGMPHGEEVLEFAPSDMNLPARRVVVPAGTLADMDDEELRSAYQRAHPIGGDHYGRPGKRMRDVT